MQPHSWVALVTIAALLVYFWMGIGVAGATNSLVVVRPAAGETP